MKQSAMTITQSACGGYEVKATGHNGTTITLQHLTTEERALAWAETWWSNYKAGSTQMQAYCIANAFLYDHLLPDDNARSK